MAARQRAPLRHRAVDRSAASRKPKRLSQPPRQSAPRDPSTPVYVTPDHAGQCPRCLSSGRFPEPRTPERPSHPPAIASRTSTNDRKRISHHAGQFTFHVGLDAVPGDLAHFGRRAHLETDEIEKHGLVHHTVVHDNENQHLNRLGFRFLLNNHHHEPSPISVVFRCSHKPDRRSSRRSICRPRNWSAASSASMRSCCSRTSFPCSAITFTATPNG